jgi:hypothetical protein
MTALAAVIAEFRCVSLCLPSPLPPLSAASFIIDHAELAVVLAESSKLANLIKARGGKGVRGGRSGGAGERMGR